MDADYESNVQTMTNDSTGKKKSAFSKALNTAKPKFDPGENQ